MMIFANFFISRHEEINHNYHLYHDFYFLKLKCLNIKNSDDYKGVTSIHEAVLLSQRLKEE